MSGVNKVILVGNLGKDPEVRYLDSGVAVANFSLATTENYKNKEGERVSQTEWHNIVFWRGLAEVAEKYLRKGDSVYVEGKIRTRKWEDKEGNTRYSTEILSDNMTMLGKKNPKETVNQELSSNEKLESNDIIVSKQKPDGGMIGISGMVLSLSKIHEVPAIGVVADTIGTSADFLAAERLSKWIEDSFSIPLNLDLDTTEKTAKKLLQSMNPEFIIPF